jgi:hypothetical protein
VLIKGSKGSKIEPDRTPKPLFGQRYWAAAAAGPSGCREEPAARSNKPVIAGFLWNRQRPVRLSGAEFFREEAGGGPAAQAVYRHSDLNRVI